MSVVTTALTDAIGRSGNDVGRRVSELGDGVVTGVFERYFFKQPFNSITKEEFERLVNSVTNVDSR